MIHKESIIKIDVGVKSAIKWYRDIVTYVMRKNWDTRITYRVDKGMKMRRDKQQNWPRNPKLRIKNLRFDKPWSRVISKGETKWSLST